MKTSKMIDEITVEQRAWSANLGCTVRYDALRGLVIERSDKPDLVDENLGMSHFVIATDDWMLSPKTLEDFNDILHYMNTKDGVTFVMDDTLAYYFSQDNFSSLIDFMSFKDIVHGKWLMGAVPYESIKRWGTK